MEYEIFNLKHFQYPKKKKKNMNLGRVYCAHRKNAVSLPIIIEKLII